MELFEEIREIGTDGIPNYKVFINGKWVYSSNNEFIDVINPANEKVIGRIPSLTKKDVENAIDAACSNKITIRKIPGIGRIEILEKARIMLEEKKEIFVDMLVKEAGKPVSISQGEVEATIDRLRFAMEEARVTYGSYIPGDWVHDSIGKFALVIRQPRGVICAITPFNYPLFSAAAKIVPATLAGNTIVVKPSSKTPLSLILFIRILEKAGIPSGCINCVTGSGGEIGDVLSQSEKINMITFTGSTKVGHQIAKNAGMKKLHLELGGKAAAIVLSDADLDLAAKEVAKGGLKYSGQRCDAIDRVLLEEKIADKFIKKLLDVVKNNFSVIGDPADPKTQVGPLIDEKAVSRVDRLVNDALKKGAKLVLGGKYTGLYYKPTIIDHVTQEMEVAWEESFGPVIPIIRVKDIEEAIEISNKSNYGLDSCIFTDDVYKAIGAGRRLEDGEVTINAAPGHGVGNFPFGGNKDSGMGREGIGYSIDEMSKIHTIVFSLPPISRPYGR
jgi:acyl-CoA reductase-like NAD-dependent aldehyde dehydrogenase